jgi:hypothetical protein
MAPKPKPLPTAAGRKSRVASKKASKKPNADLIELGRKFDAQCAAICKLEDSPRCSDAEMIEANGDLIDIENEIWNATARTAEEAAVKARAALYELQKNYFDQPNQEEEFAATLAKHLAETIEHLAVSEKRPGAALASAVNAVPNPGAR